MPRRNSPENLLAENVLLLRADTGRWKAILLHHFLDPHTQVTEAMLVESKKNLSKMIH